MENDPTIYLPCGHIDIARANQIYGELFLTCFEFLYFNRVVGDILEFGTYKGFTARLISTMMKAFQFDHAALHLFDSFEGLPDTEGQGDKASYEVTLWKSWRKGTMALPAGIEKDIHTALSEIIPAERIIINKGYFEETVPSRLPMGKKACLVHVDCDMYSSAKHVMDNLFKFNFFQDGAILVMDDYNCSCANPDMGERRALRESFEAQDRFQYEEFRSYGWNGKAFIVHDMLAAKAINQIADGQQG